MTKHHTVRLRVMQARSSDVYRAIARIPEEHRKDVNGKTIAEGGVCRLKIDGKPVRLWLRGEFRTSAPVILLDERTRKDLGLTDKQEVDVAIRKGCALDTLCWSLGSPDPSYRLSTKLALLSVLLGAVGLVLGCLSLRPRSDCQPAQITPLVQSAPVAPRDLESTAHEEETH